MKPSIGKIVYYWFKCSKDGNDDLHIADNEVVLKCHAAIITDLNHVRTYPDLTEHLSSKVGLHVFGHYSPNNGGQPLRADYSETPKHKHWCWIKEED